MNTGISSNKIAIDENLMETVQHGDRNYPFKFIMKILHCLISIVWNGTGIQNWSLYMLNQER